MTPRIFSINKNGEKIDYTVILTFKNETNQKDYVVYTDNEYDEENKLKIYAAIYNPLNNEFIKDVEEQKDWDEIYRLLDKVLLQ